MDPGRGPTGPGRALAGRRRTADRSASSPSWSERTRVGLARRATAPQPSDTAPNRPGRPDGPVIRTDRPDLPRGFAADRTGGRMDPTRPPAAPARVRPVRGRPDPRPPTRPTASRT